MNEAVRIGDRLVGDGQPVFVVAEAGVNHDGDLVQAERLVDAAAAAGADAVKFQTFDVERLVSRDAPKADYQLRTTPPDESQRAMLERLQLDRDAFETLAERCRSLGLTFLSTPFDEESADLLEELGVPAFKLGSGELTNTRLVEHVASFRKPVLLSTGMAYLDEVRDAVRLVHAAGADAVVLHCVSSYPAEPADANLRALATMRVELGVPVGYSDHTVGTEAALAAVALGACVLEKHLTLDRELPGPDHAASLEPGELGSLIASIRTVEAALGDGVKQPAPSELANRDAVRRSLHAAATIPAGAEISAELVVSLRPGDGIPPNELDRVLGRTARREIAAGDRIRWDDLG